MKRMKAIPAMLLAAVLVAGLFPALPAAAAGDIYVNGPDSVLAGALDGAFAVGGGGTSLVSGSYVLTADGVVTIDGQSGSSGGSSGAQRSRPPRARTGANRSAGSALS